MTLIKKYLAVACMAFALTATTAHAAPPVQEVKWRDLSAWLVKDDSLPLVTVEMSWRGGTAGETHPGLTMLMTRLMNEGAGNLDGQTFQKALADKAISLSFDADHDYVTARLRCLTRHRASCFALLKLALQKPRFDADAITRMKAEQEAALRSAQQSPRGLASQAFQKLAYPQHNYGRTKHGTAEGLAAIERSDIVARHDAVFARNNLKLAMVGDISRAEARRFMRDMFAAQPTKSAVPAHDDVVMATGPKTEHIDRAGPQTTLVFGHQGIGYDHELFFPAFVMNSILGGSGFSSRLTEEVREARGLAYSVYSYWSVSRHGASWRGSVATDNKATQEALDVIRTEMVRMAEQGVSATRLEAAKTYLTGAYALRFDSGGKIAQQLIGLQEMGRPISYLHERNQAINAVTQDDIKRAAGLLFADKLLVVSVGQTAVSLAPSD